MQEKVDAIIKQESGLNSAEQSNDQVFYKEMSLILPIQINYTPNVKEGVKKLTR